MIRAFHTSATGMNAQQMVLDNTANNLANVNTTGFKRSQVEFQDLFYQTYRQPGSEIAAGRQIPTGLQIGNGVRVASTTRIFTTGAADSTGNELDVAIEGPGFFQITMPDGSFRYTRDGAFRLNANRELVTTDGYLVQPGLTVPPDATRVTINPDGSVSVTSSTSPPQTTSIGNIQLAMFANPSGLSGEGQNLYSETPASGTAQLVAPETSGAGRLKSSFLERSNVEVVRELVNLIQAQRAYEFNTKAIKVADEMLSNTNELVR